MADEDPRPDEKHADGEDAPRTPFDNPFFLPVMLWIFVAWFGWDAWIVPMEEHLAFNRYGFFVVLVLALWFTRRGLREHREDKQRDAGRDESPPLS